MMGAMPGDAAEARDRLSRLMGSRRADLRLQWSEVAERAGLTREGLLNIRKGTGDIRPLSKRGIEDALQWASGSVDAILAGGEPSPLLVDPGGPAPSTGERFDPLGDLPEDRPGRIAEVRRRQRALTEELDRLLGIPSQPPPVPRERDDGLAAG